MSRSPFDHVPVEDPGTPNLQSVPRFLLWVGLKQKRIIATGVFFGVINLLCVAIMPGSSTGTWSNGERGIAALPY